MQENKNDHNKTTHLLILPHAGSKGEKRIRSIKNSLKCVLPDNISVRVTYSRQGIRS